MASKLAEVDHPVVCPPQWLPVLLASTHKALSTTRLAAACSPHWVVGNVDDLPATASMLPGIVTLNGSQVGHPVQAGSACDQIASVGVADGIVRGLSHHIGKGFSVGIVGTGGELIEFRYWNAAKKKLYYSDYRFKMDDNAQVGSFKKPFELVLRETPLCTNPCAKCSHFLIAGKFAVPAAAGGCVEDKGTCQKTSAPAGPCVGGSKVTSEPCYTACPAGSHPSTTLA